MGTRCLTIVMEEGINLVNMYKHTDGYPTGHGKELADFLSGKTLIRGIGGGDNTNNFNGMGCLAASMIAHFKNGIGDCYLYPVNVLDVDEKYIYVVFSVNGEIHMKVTFVDNQDEVIFSGKPENYDIKENN